MNQQIHCKRKIIGVVTVGIIKDNMGEKNKYMHVYVEKDLEGHAMVMEHYRSILLATCSY